MNLTGAKELAILAILSAHGTHGYSLATEFEQSFGPFLGISRATVYAILERFKRRGWIAGNVRKGTSHPDREVFRITKAGRQATEELYGQLEQNADLPQSPLLALLMASEDTGSTVDTGALIAERKSSLAGLRQLADDGHRDSAALQLCRRLVEAELSVLRSIKAG